MIGHVRAIKQLSKAGKVRSNICIWQQLMTICIAISHINAIHAQAQLCRSHALAFDHTWTNVLDIPYTVETQIFTLCTLCFNKRATFTSPPGNRLLFC